MLSAADDEEFFTLLWAGNLLQTRHFNAAIEHLDRSTIPEGAVTESINSPFSIQKWEIETLANEILTVPKARFVRNGSERKLNCKNMRALFNCINFLRKIENAELRIGKKKESIHIELGRIASRQFDWQRGYDNAPLFYRNLYIYGQGACAEYFAEKNSLSIDRFSWIGFAIYASLTLTPRVFYDGSWSNLGISRDEFYRVLALISKPHFAASKAARRERRDTIHISDKPSVFRRTPCIRFGRDSELVLSPLPQLILERITSGVFYDLADGPMAVRSEYARRFESYCFDCLSRSLGKYEWKREFRYGRKGFPFDSPDIMSVEGGRVRIAIECKATRMSHQAMFGADPFLSRGYQELANGVFQIWRFFSHARRNTIGQGVVVDADMIGVVLTLDNWLVMSETLEKRVLDEARNLAAEKDAQINEVDQRPVIFVAATELESALSVSDEATFSQALELSQSKQYRGWRLDGIARDIAKKANLTVKRGYPFVGEIKTLIPWWSQLDSGVPK